ncbi:MAG: glycerol kinase GlpK [Acidimicrobiia bacterium]|nr:glycerol kinase GlpK [Acidimicrobiia bacterium]
MTEQRSAPHVLAIDAGTTSVRCLAIAPDCTVTASSQREFAQHYPRPGWVEHDATEIWDGVRACVIDVCANPALDRESIRGIGMTNQRETVVAWDRRTGTPLAPAIVWQDRRTADRCAELREAGSEEETRRITGLRYDPYFSATKMEWLIRNTLDVGPDLCFGTIDTWLTFKLTGGAYVTDASNASRTLLFDLHTGTWSDVQLARFGIPRHSLPEIVDSSGDVGRTDPSGLGGLRVPVAGMAGDQQCALFGQACVESGMAKNTYGTGSFVLVNAGDSVPEGGERLLSTVAWRLGGKTTYALEGSIFVTGAAVKWLRDKVGLLESAAETGPVAESVPDTAGVVVVPAFTGLGAPHWDPYARGAVFGLANGVTRAHVVRAVVESMTFQTRDVVEAMTDVLGTAPVELRVDGGAAVMDILCRLQADQLGIPVLRPRSTETTALGAAFLAGLATGQWDSLDTITHSWQAESRFEPAGDRAAADMAYARWQRAVARVVAFGTG